MTEVANDISMPSVGTQAEVRFRKDFGLTRTLPTALEPLDAISRNFYWSWQPDGVALFRDLDPVLWDQCEQNPRLLLKKVSGMRLYQRAADAQYLERLSAFASRSAEYLSVAARTGHAIAYFCAEYGVHNSLPNYSGGLGILAGDHLKSASDLNLPLTAIGLLYRYGYFRQRIGHDGWQQESYSDVFDSELAIEPLIDDSGERITTCVHIRGREVVAQAWLARVGRISLYLLDTNVPQNSEIDRFITGHLYGGDTETRIVQEKVLGIGGVRLLRKLGISPSVYHLNEGHAAFSTLELAKEFIETNPGATFADAAEFVRTKCVFTTHTPVAAGNDVFAPNELIACFSREFIDALKLSDNEFLALGRADLSDDNESFGMTPLAIRMCRSTNGVSEKHGDVSRGLWLKMFPGLADAADVPITSVTNGVHPPTWIAPFFQAVYRQYLGDDWPGMIQSKTEWASTISGLPDELVWQTHQTLKRLLIALIRKKTQAKDTGDIDTIHEHADTGGLLSPDILTIGFARRVAAYKRWDLLFTDLQRLLRMVDDEGHAVQFIFAGKAHPQDKTAKTILQELMRINHDSHWQRRAIFLEDYDQEIARYMVQGVDVWLNLPRRPMEASGTSGMKAAMNGVLNASILDGWWIEGYNGKNGFAIGDVAEARTPVRAPSGEVTDEETDARDAESLYSLLEDQIIPTYYSRSADGLPLEWIRMMKKAIATLTPQFSSDRMVSDYLTRVYKTNI
jgi:starch phosphorylase